MTYRISLACLLLAWSSLAGQNRVVITVSNPSAIPRPNETVELSAAEILRAVPAPSTRHIHITDETGRDLITQSIDMTGDGVPDLLIFQADLGSAESRTFTLKAGKPQYPDKDQFRAYGRFVRERFDDFAWENDRIAHRMYGQALETWQREPLTSSAVDIWCKRVRRLIINDWYMVDDYHEDQGEGADFYSAGKSRGCGGTGLWNSGKLIVSRNFIDSRVIASGPIRVVFELTFPPVDLEGAKVAEIKRVSLDAGHFLNHFESTYLTDSQRALTFAAGIKKSPDSMVHFSPEDGWMSTWEPVKGDNGFIGCGIIVPPGQTAERADADGNYLVLMKSREGTPAAYYAGFCWDRSGDFATLAEWERYLKETRVRLSYPLRIRTEQK